VASLTFWVGCKADPPAVVDGGGDGGSVDVPGRGVLPPRQRLLRRHARLLTAKQYGHRHSGYRTSAFTHVHPDDRSYICMRRQYR
jgi:hypothetical protein